MKNYRVITAYNQLPTHLSSNSLIHAHARTIEFRSDLLHNPYPVHYVRSTTPLLHYSFRMEYLRDKHSVRNCTRAPYRCDKGVHEPGGTERKNREAGRQVGRRVGGPFFETTVVGIKRKTGKSKGLLNVWPCVIA